MDIRVMIQLDVHNEYIDIKDEGNFIYTTGKKWWCGKGVLEDKRDKVFIYEVDNSVGPWEVVRQMLYQCLHYS